MSYVGKPCTQCQTLMRSGRVKTVNAEPGTVAHAARGLCKGCYNIVHYKGKPRPASRFALDNPRFCEFCEGPITPRSGVSRTDWMTARWCGRDCQSAWYERKWELDVIDVKHLVMFRVFHEDIARRLGYTVSSLRKRLHERGEHKLARYFDVSESQEVAA